MKTLHRYILDMCQGAKGRSGLVCLYMQGLLLIVSMMIYYKSFNMF